MSAEFNSSLCTHHSALRLKALKRAAHVVNGGRGGGPARALLLLRVKLLALLQLAAGALFVAVGGQRRAEVPAVERVVAAALGRPGDRLLQLLDRVAVESLAVVDPAERVGAARR